MMGHHASQNRPNTCFPRLLLDHQVPVLISGTQCPTREKGEDKMMEDTCAHQGRATHVRLLQDQETKM